LEGNGHSEVLWKWRENREMEERGKRKEGEGGWFGGKQVQLISGFKNRSAR